MKFKIFIILLGLFACQSQNKKMETPILLSAEKSQWFGGIEGVQGIHFNLTLKSKQKITFDQLVFNENQKLKIKQTEKEEVYYLTSSWTVKRQERTLSLGDKKVETQKIQKLSNTAKLYYHYNDNTENSYFILVKFIHKEDKPQMYP